VIYHVHVRITIDVPDALVRKLQALASRRSVSMEAAIRLAIEEGVRGERAMPARRIKFPLLRSKEPGSLVLTNAEIENLI
jgi:predicted transcriptional regulator